MKSLAVLISLIFAFISFTQSAGAHVFVTDKSIGAVLYIKPNDDPIVKKPSNFYFDIKDKQGKFSFSKCECSVSIQKDPGVIFKYAFPQEDDTLPGFTYAFPKKAVYKVIFTGNPISKNEFSSFKLRYDIRVDREESSSINIADQFLPHWQHYIVAGASVVAFGVLYIVQSKKKSKR